MNSMKTRETRGRLGVALPLWLAGLTGCTTAQTSVVIKASPSTVWRILTDGPRYSEWNPVHVRLEGEVREGATVKIHLREPSGKVSVFDSKVRRTIPERELNQGGGVPGIFTFNHTFLLEPAFGGTHVIQREEFRGIGVVLTNMGWVEEAYQRVNAALKARAESIESAGLPPREQPGTSPVD
jgi:hypothetical protein